MAGKGNSTIIDGKIVHKKCPTINNKKKEQDPNKLALIEEVYRQFSLYAKGYIKEGGFNHYKLLNQINKLHEEGFSYQEQMYALNKIVKEQNGFYGYTAVVNNIHSIISKKRMKDNIKKDSCKNNNKDVVFDLSKILKGGDDEW